MIRALALVSAVSCVSGFTLSMGLDPVLSKAFPRDFKRIPLGTEYGTGQDEVLNKAVESRRMEYLENDLQQ
eukprot:gene17239-23408_t